MCRLTMRTTCVNNRFCPDPPGIVTPPVIARATVLPVAIRFPHKKSDAYASDFKNSVIFLPMVQSGAWMQVS